MTSLLPRGPPKLGRKQVFLPDFTLTLVRTPFLPPTFASFIVPLNLNKLDLRDYLWNAYGIRVTAVRSYIQQQKVKQGRDSDVRPRARQWTRPRSIKKMTVEMEKPFVWPDVPEDLSPWDQDTWNEMIKARTKEQQHSNGEWKRQPTDERASIAQQAKALLSGKEQWKTSNRSLWVDDGEAKEVEKDVSLPKDSE